MPAQVTYPGVYVQEEASGAQAIAAASTSVALFVGMADKGAFGVPTKVLSQIEYERNFGATSKGEMADQVRQFYVNGGTVAWIMRIANDAHEASVTLKNEAGANTLTLTARDKGYAGNLICAEVDYDTTSPERTFNLTLYRISQKTDGTFDKRETEIHPALSMDHGNSRYAPNIVNGGSKLVTLTDLNAAAAVNGLSVGGLIHNATTATAKTSVNSVLSGGTGAFSIAIGNNPPVRVVVPTGTDPNVLTTIGTAIKDAYTNQLGISVNAVADLKPLGGGQALQITSTTGAVVISGTSGNDVTTALMLGTIAGGIEADSTSVLRPAPTGLASMVGPLTGAADPATWFANLAGFTTTVRNTLDHFGLTDPSSTLPAVTNQPVTFSTLPLTDSFVKGAVTGFGTAVGALTYVRTALDELATAVGAQTTARWKVKRAGYRITLVPTFDGPNSGLDGQLTTTGGYAIENAGNLFDKTKVPNVSAYSLGRQDATVPPVGKQTNAAADAGRDGVKPLLTDYQDAINVLDSELDSFNLMMLPRADAQTDTERHGLWGIASAFAAKKRAILLVDPDSAWVSISDAENGIAALKIGVETRNAAAYWPRLIIPDATIPSGRTVDPSGSMAGLMARTDTRFGVWTAAAGIEATVRGVTGIGKNMSDDENGQLNPKALNAIRLFASQGVVAWGARTMAGADGGIVDDKYLPVRRTMLFIEESLYQGLKFAVFRPNAEPLWANIRLAAGSFMNGLMRQGAFASMNKMEAYYVLCDKTTTTETDINLGIVNVIVAFAPLKPAEFVVLTVKQIAGQVAV